MNSYLKLIFINLLLLVASTTWAQVVDENAVSVDENTVSTTEESNVLSGSEIPEVNYSHPQEYTISEITTSGKNNYEDYVLIGYSGLKKGEKITIPGDAISNVVKRFWKQGLFKDVRVEIAAIRGREVWLNIHLDQRPKISQINFIGAKKKEIEEIEKGMGLTKGGQVTPYGIDKAKRFITNYYQEKGYYYVKSSVTPREEEGSETIVDIRIDKGVKTKVNHLIFEGNDQVSTKKLDRAMKKTNDRSNFMNIFRSKKFIPAEYKNDKVLLIDKYNELGYRDAEILCDSVYADTTLSTDKKKYVNVYIKLNEGQQYKIRNINWIGNTIYNTDYLNQVLGFKKGANTFFSLNLTSKIK